MTMLKQSLIASLGFLAIADCASITISASSQAPTTSPIDHSFPGFGIDGVFLTEYAGKNQVNARDHTAYKASLEEPLEKIPEDEQKNGIEYNVGPPYFDAIASWPGVKWIYQTPLGYGSLDNSVAMVRQGVKAIGTENLHAIEIGNEPNTKAFSSPKDYVQQWLNYSAAISANVSELPTGPIYQGLTLASSALAPFTIETMFADGVDRRNNLKTVSHHFYEIFGNEVTTTAEYLQSTLLNHSYLVQSTGYIKSAVQFLQQNQSGLPLVLGEIGSGLARGNTNQTQIAQLESSLGTAVWTVDFHMYMMTLGVQSISNQLGTPWTFVPWTANVTNNHGATYPPYYAILFTADALGADTSSPTHVRELSSPDGNITAYGIYQNSTLTKIAICNLELWSAKTSSVARPHKQIVLNLSNNVRSKSATVEKLAAPDGFDRFNTTYGGFSYTYENQGEGTKVHDNTEKLEISGGTLTVNVTATEAVLVKLD
ncbi:hypothetical protein MMC10_010372 [Thelotrema lepadinum]|nr:hypothetical protein [Thelotrema lepadinum]